MHRKVMLAFVLVAAGCGGEEQHANGPRPAPPVVMTAAVHDDLIRVSPTTVGAGAITLVVSNQSDRPQRVTFETDELGGATGGNRASSGTIAPRATGRLTIDAREGNYSVHVGDRGVRAARVMVGPPRPSSQDTLLLP